MAQIRIEGSAPMPVDGFELLGKVFLPGPTGGVALLSVSRLGRVVDERLVAAGSTVHVDGLGVLSIGEVSAGPGGMHLTADLGHAAAAAA